MNVVVQIMRSWLLYTTVTDYCALFLKVTCSSYTLPNFNGFSLKYIFYNFMNFIKNNKDIL